MLMEFISVVPDCLLDMVLFILFEGRGQDIICIMPGDVIGLTYSGKLFFRNGVCFQRITQPMMSISVGVKGMGTLVGPSFLPPYVGRGTLLPKIRCGKEKVVGGGSAGDGGLGPRMRVWEEVQRVRMRAGPLGDGYWRGSML